jgi:hypothetical protein
VLTKPPLSLSTNQSEKTSRYIRKTGFCSDHPTSPHNFSLQQTSVHIVWSFAVWWWWWWWLAWFLLVLTNCIIPPQFLCLELARRVDYSHFHNLAIIVPQYWHFFCSMKHALDCRTFRSNVYKYHGTWRCKILLSHHLLHWNIRNRNHLLSLARFKFILLHSHLQPETLQLKTPLLSIKKIQTCLELLRDSCAHSERGCSRSHIHSSSTQRQWRHNQFN